MNAIIWRQLLVSPNCTISTFYQLIQYYLKTDRVRIIRKLHESVEFQSIAVLLLDNKEVDIKAAISNHKLVIQKLLLDML
jgi:hypothetical protein